jgi:hypothetical protein
MHLDGVGRALDHGQIRQRCNHPLRPRTFLRLPPQRPCHEVLTRPEPVSEINVAQSALSPGSAMVRSWSSAGLVRLHRRPWPCLQVDPQPPRQLHLRRCASTRWSTILVWGYSTGPPRDLPYGPPSSVHRVGKARLRGPSLPHQGVGGRADQRLRHSSRPAPARVVIQRLGRGMRVRTRVSLARHGVSLWPTDRRGQGRDALVQLAEVRIGHTVLHQAQRIGRSRGVACQRFARVSLFASGRTL